MKTNLVETRKARMTFENDQYTRMWLASQWTRVIRKTVFKKERTFDEALWNEHRDLTGEM